MISNQGGRTEIIAACGFGETTQATTFTRVLIGELKRMARFDFNFDQHISTVQLHANILRSMSHQTVRDRDDPGMFLTSVHSFAAPVYTTLSRDYSHPSIPLKRFQLQVAGRSVGSSINSGPRRLSQVTLEEVENIAEPTDADQPKSSSPALGSPTPVEVLVFAGLLGDARSLLETPEEPEPAEIELVLNQQR
jgi:hypothetical protein